MLSVSVTVACAVFYFRSLLCHSRYVLVCWPQRPEGCHVWEVWKRYCERLPWWYDGLLTYGQFRNNVSPFCGHGACITSAAWGCHKYRQTSSIKHTSIGNKIVDHSDVVGAVPVGAASTTSSFSTYHLLQWTGPRQLQDETRNIYIFGFGAYFIRGLMVFPYLGCGIESHDPFSGYEICDRSIGIRNWLMKIFHSLISSQI